MPASRPLIKAHPAKPFRTLADAARSGQLVLLRCNLCKRGATFSAADLAVVVGPSHPVHVSPFECSQCGKYEYVDIRVETPSFKDYGKRRVRTLCGSKKV